MPWTINPPTRSLDHCFQQDIKEDSSSDDNYYLSITITLITNKYHVVGMSQSNHKVFKYQSICEDINCTVGLVKDGGEGLVY